MIRIKNLFVPYEEVRSLETLAAERLGVSPCAVHGVIVVHKALDARCRNGTPIRWNYTIDVEVKGSRGILMRMRRDGNVQRAEQPQPLAVPPYTPQRGCERPIVVGFGPVPALPLSCSNVGGMWITVCGMSHASGRQDCSIPHRMYSLVRAGQGRFPTAS